MNTPKNGALSGMIITGLTAAVVLSLGLASADFRSHFAAPLSPALVWTFFASIVAMALHKAESFWFEEFEQCPVYLTSGQAAWARNPRKVLFIGFVPTFLGMMGLTFLAFLGPPWHLLVLTIWLGQGAHELHHLAKSLARGRLYPGTFSSLLFVGIMWFGVFPLWHDLVLGARGALFVAVYAALPLVFLAYYFEDRRWLSGAPAHFQSRRRLAGLAATALVLLSSTAFARPPARDHAAPEIVSGTDSQTAGARFLATLPSGVRRELERKGQAVIDRKPGESLSLLRAVIRFDRPRDEVFALITQPSSQVHYLPHVTQSKTVGAHTEEGEVNDMVVTFLFSLRYRTQHWFYPEESRMEWNLDASGETGLSEQLGFFQLYALDEKTTIAEYGTRVVARDGFLDFLRGIGERGGVEEALLAVRKHVELAKR